MTFPRRIKWTLDANKPRIDTETGINFVTDVRLKRTMRDELYSRGYEILIRILLTKIAFLKMLKESNRFYT